jgi:hypothetical protein
MLDFVRIGEVAANECVRQGTDFDGFIRLLNAYKTAYKYLRDESLVSGDIFQLANIIEPEKNVFGKYRTTSVVFANGGFAVDRDLIPTAMDQWLQMINDPSDGLISCGPEFMRETFVREFLRIHPFRDGNGRVAWILRTLFYDNWESPDPLPKYFPGE